MGQEKEQGQDASLKISVRQKDGKPYTGAVDIECQHQTLSDRHDIRGVEASRPITISGLKRGPQGIYRLTVTPTDVNDPQMQFVSIVSIPASGSASIEATLSQQPGSTTGKPPHLGGSDIGGEV